MTWEPPSESIFTKPTEICPHPEWWRSENYMAAEVEVSELVAALVKAAQPEFVVEIGSHYGQTAYRIAQVIVGNDHSKFVSLEIDHDLCGSALHRCEALLCKQFQILNLDSRKYIPAWPVDFLFVDGAPDRSVDVAHYLPYMAKRSLIVVHDTAAYLDENKKIIELCGQNYVKLDTPRGMMIIKVEKA